MKQKEINITVMVEVEDDFNEEIIDKIGVEIMPIDDDVKVLSIKTTA